MTDKQYKGNLRLLLDDLKEIHDGIFGIPGVEKAVTKLDKLLLNIQNTIED